MSLIENRNTKGQRLDPWGTPDVDAKENDFTPLYSTNCLRFETYAFIVHIRVERPMKYRN